MGCLRATLMTSELVPGNGDATLMTSELHPGNGEAISMTPKLAPENGDATVMASKLAPGNGGVMLMTPPPTCVCIGQRPLPTVLRRIARQCPTCITNTVNMQRWHHCVQVASLSGDYFPRYYDGLNREGLFANTNGWA